MGFRDLEEYHQAALIEWAGYQVNLGACPELKWLFHVPNGEKRDPRTGAKLQRLGVKKGVPDLFLLVPRGGYSGLVIELKATRGRLSDEQREWIEELNRHNFKAVVCYGWDSAQKEIEKYLGSGADEDN